MAKNETETWTRIDNLPPPSVHVWVNFSHEYQSFMVKLLIIPRSRTIYEVQSPILIDASEANYPVHLANKTNKFRVEV